MKANLKSILALVFVLAVLVSVFSGCGKKAEIKRDTLNIGMGRNITSLDGSGGGYTSTNASMQIYDCLVCLDENLKPTPALATEWSM